MITQHEAAAWLVSGVLTTAVIQRYGGGDADAARRSLAALAAGKWVIRRDPNPPDPVFPWVAFSPFGVWVTAQTFEYILSAVQRWERARRG